MVRNWAIVHNRIRAENLAFGITIKLDFGGSVLSIKVYLSLEM